MTVTRRRAYQCFVLGILLAAAAVYSPSVRAQNRLYVEAYDRQTGAIVTDLREAEVSVLEDGDVRSVVDVRLANLPVKLVLVVDNSQATVRAVEVIKEGLTAFVDRLSPGQEISLLTLAPEPRWVVQGTLDRDEARAAIDDLETIRDPAAFLDGLTEAVEWLGLESQLQRPVIVVVAADGADPSRNQAGQFETVVERVRRDGITIHALVMSTPVPGSLERRLTTPEAIGRDLGEFTGGSYATVFLGSGLEEPLDDIALRIRTRNRELSRQHLVRFERPVGAEPGEVRVDITRFGARYSITMDGRSRSSAGQPQTR